MNQWLEPQNKADWQRGPVEIDGVRFRLTLTAQGDPYILKRYIPKRPLGTSGKADGSWATAWAEWHKGKPTGIRKRAIEAMGFIWRNDTPDTLGWHRVPPADRIARL